MSHRRKVLIALGSFAAAPWLFAQQTKALRLGCSPMMMKLICHLSRHSVRDYAFADALAQT